MSDCAGNGCDGSAHQPVTDLNLDEIQAIGERWHIKSGSITTSDEEWAARSCNEGCPGCAIDALLDRLSTRQAERRPVPGSEGGPGHEEQFWQRAKLDGAIRNLRDLEDFYRMRSGTPESFNMVRADRARAIYEQISDDYLNGSMTRPTMKERAEAAEARVAELTKALERIGDSRYGDPGDGYKLVRIAREVLAGGEKPTASMPPDLVAVLRDPTVVIQRDHEIRLADGSTLAESLERWRNAPSNTASADLGET